MSAELLARRITEFHDQIRFLLVDEKNAALSMTITQVFAAELIRAALADADMAQRIYDVVEHEGYIADRRASIAQREQRRREQSEKQKRLFQQRQAAHGI